MAQIVTLPLPYQFADGQVNDAAPVLNDLNYIAAQVNANALQQPSNPLVQDTAYGYSALAVGNGSGNSTAFGYGALAVQPSGLFANTAVGANALASWTGVVGGNTAVGAGALLNSTSSFNTAVGQSALGSQTSGGPSTAVGNGALSSDVTGFFNTAVGFNCMPALNGGVQNTAMGDSAMLLMVSGGVNCAFGANALGSAVSATQCTAIGENALGNATASTNSALGYHALFALTTFVNCTGLGANTAVTASNQVQLGDASTTTFAYGAVQNRSDARDKTDVRDTLLGLEFINALRPVDYRWNYRGGKGPGKRFHHGLIAQEVPAEFGGLQDHKVNGGEDVLSIGYTELIAPLIKAVQELTARVAELEAKAK